MRSAALLLALLAGAAQADTIGLHVGSWHSRPGYNNVNPGAFYRADDGLTVGAYCNSQSRSPNNPDAPTCRPSAYAGVTWGGDGLVALTAGVVTGYTYGPLPIVLPSIKLGPVRVGVLPKVEPMGAWVVHAMLEMKL